MRVVNNPEDIGKCGCGRSPNGKCIGWHGLNESDYQAKLAAWHAAQAENAGQPVDSSTQKIEIE